MFMVSHAADWVYKSSCAEFGNGSSEAHRWAYGPYSYRAALLDAVATPASPLERRPVHAFLIHALLDSSIIGDGILFLRNPKLCEQDVDASIRSPDGENGMFAFRCGNFSPSS